MKLKYEINPKSIDAAEVLSVMTHAGTALPNWTVERMERALLGSNVFIAVYDDKNLIGIARAISDFAWVAYLSHLAVLPEYQGKGIGKELVDLLLREIGDEVSLLVHSADRATGFYESAGFERYNNVYRIPRRH